MSNCKRQNKGKYVSSTSSDDGFEFTVRGRQPVDGKITSKTYAKLLDDARMVRKINGQKGKTVH